MKIVLTTREYVEELWKRCFMRTESFILLTNMVTISLKLEYAERCSSLEIMARRRRFVRFSPVCFSSKSEWWVLLNFAAPSSENFIWCLFYLDHSFGTGSGLMSFLPSLHVQYPNFTTRFGRIILYDVELSGFSQEWVLRAKIPRDLVSYVA
jgi:hypothetical protein